MSSNTKLGNLILDSVPSNDFDTISTELKEVVLEKDTVLFESGRRSEFVYFPVRSVISVMGNTGEGGTIEVWAVGNEGAAGVFAIAGRSKPFRGLVQVPGTAF